MKLIDLDAVDDEEVEAIPVKWLEESRRNSMDAQWHYAVEIVLQKWRGEWKKNKNKVGEWEPLGHIIGSLNHPWSEYFKCSLCGYHEYTLLSPPSKECPNCGATMIQEENNGNED